MNRLPHQCLKCGELFNEGSTTILRGCPECKGTRFFYTQVPLSTEERSRLLSTSEITLREAIDQLAKQAKEGTLTPADTDDERWVLSGPPAASVVADPAIVPQDLPAPSPTLSVLLDEKKLVVKVPPKPRKLRRSKQSNVRWDYAAPDASTPTEQPTAPPLFSTVGLKTPLTPSAASDAASVATPAIPPAPPVVAPPTGPTTASPVTTDVPTTHSETLVAAPEATPGTSSIPATFEAPTKLELPASFQVPAPLNAVDPPILAAEGPPETIRISKPGEYEIDVKRLLEDNPIVIQRDGTYLIHLASLFEAGKGKRA